jgi:hypothetical protein
MHKDQGRRQSPRFIYQKLLCFLGRVRQEIVPEAAKIHRQVSPFAQENAQSSARLFFAGWIGARDDRMEPQAG